jgi:hypothetical protein
VVGAASVHAEQVRPAGRISDVDAQQVRPAESAGVHVFDDLAAGGGGGNCGWLGRCGRGRLGSCGGGRRGCGVGFPRRRAAARGGLDARKKTSLIGPISNGSN